jgi:hypothetical protein
MANDGTGADGDVFDLTPHILEMGAVSWEIDRQLTKMTPGSMTLTVADPDEKLWNWLEERVLSKDGALPPWFWYDVGDRRLFLGILPLSQCSRVRAERVLTLEALDWSTMLSGVVLQGPLWERWMPAETGKFELSSTYKAAINPRRQREWIVTTHWVMDDGFFLTVENPRVKDPNNPGGPNKYPANWLSPGDMVWVLIREWQGPNRQDIKLNKRYRVLGVSKPPPTTLLGMALALSGGDGTFVRLNGLHNDVGGLYERSAPHPSEVTVTRLGRGLEGIRTYTVLDIKFMTDKAREENRYLRLSSVAGLVLGDTLELLDPTNKATFTIQQIDATRNMVLCREAVKYGEGGVEPKMEVYLSDDDRATMVFEDARLLILNACHFSDEVTAEPGAKNDAGDTLTSDGSFPVDFSRFFRAELPRPFFAWIPLRSLEGGDVLPVNNVTTAVWNETTPEGEPVAVRCGLKVFHNRMAWLGNPDIGWMPTDNSVACAEFSSQIAGTPKWLMPVPASGAVGTGGAGGGAWIFPAYQKCYTDYDGGGYTWHIDGGNLY